MLQDVELRAVKLRELRSSATSLTLADVPLPSYSVTITCGVPSGRTGPFILFLLCHQVFDKLHGTSHPVLCAAQRLIASRFVRGQV